MSVACNIRVLRRAAHGRAIAVAVMAVGLSALACCERAPSDSEDSSASANEDHARASPGQPVRFVAAEPAPRPTDPLPPDASCVTAACHAGFAVAEQVHSPVGLGRCEACHQPDTGNHTFPLKRPGNQTCTFCHDLNETGTHIHEPMEEEFGCIVCHDPHAAPGKFLLPSNRVSQLCADCHELPLKRFVHNPVAEGHCTLCHQPHRADNALLLRGGRGVDHCVTCHGDMIGRLAEATYRHTPTSNCSGCHDAHTSSHAYLLEQTVRDNCASCHRFVDEQARDAAVQHEAVTDEKSCANCHDPHGSSHPALLDQREEQLCLACHNQTLKTPDGRRIENIQPMLQRAFLHGPVRDGDCGACHNVHGAPYTDLLTERFPETFYTAFDLQKYELCFSCHEADLVMHERTRGLTGFRDGDLNLHYVHVHRDDRGRTCRTCHAVHGSDLPRHMAEAVPFQGSDWMMPIAFEKTDTGGRCAPGCHEPMRYNRDQSPGQAQRADPTDQKDQS
jgi:predicted CXXCH cytochrome family protein